MNIAELLRLIHNLIRLGTIDQVDHETARVRVRSGGNLTGWLRWLSFRAGTTRDWDPPTVGEQVIIFSPGGDLSAGIVLTGLNSNAHAAPSTDPDVWLREFPDGAVVEYNHETHALKLTLPGESTMEVISKLTTIIGDVRVNGNLFADGDFKVSGDTQFDGGSVKHQDKEIGKSHNHPIKSGSSAPGPTGEVQ